MKILVIGGGGREHALAWKAAQSDKVDTVFVAPGNAGTANENKLKNVDINVEDVAGLVEFSTSENIGLVIVGPEAPLVLGVVDAMREASIPVFGPTQGAAQLEGSKAFTKDFLARHNIPTADYANFSEIAPAIEYIKSKGAPIVVKADGLAAGKGVVVAQTEQEAIDAVHSMLGDGKFGDAGTRVVIEEFLVGEEASFIVMVDGKNVLPLATSQDHKARDNGDQGPNTGGMGAYSPAPAVTPAMHDRIMNEVILPTVKGMDDDGYVYTGFLYAGIMIAPDGTPKVLEFNCRFGDPETQPIMMRLESDLVDLCIAGVNGVLNTVEAKWDPRACVGVVMAAGGYPESYAKGEIIAGLDAHQTDTYVFQAGTKQSGENITTNGGRVLCVCGLGQSVTEAQQLAYKRLKSVTWKDVYYRTDIGHRAIAREKIS